MRMGIVVAGVVLLIIGAVLMFVPLVQQPDQNVNTSSSSFPFGAVQISGFSLTGSIPLSVSWTSTGAVTVFAATCGSGCENAASASAIGGIVIQTGTSGTFTLSQPDGGYLVFGAISSSGSGTGTPANVTFKITTALSTVGSILLIVGILLLILGIVLKSKKAKMAAMPPPAPAGDMSQSGTMDPPSAGGGSPPSS